MAIACAIPLVRLFVRDHFGQWLAAHFGIDVLTIDSEKLIDWSIITLSAGAGIWGWISKRVPTWAAMLALLGAALYLGIQAGNASWRTEHFVEMLAAVALGIVGLALVVWRVWCGLSPRAPNTPPVSGTESLGPLVANLVAR
jgi:hypothetical protein